MAIAKASFGKGFSTVINYVMIQKKVPLDLQPVLLECNNLRQGEPAFMAKQMLEISRDHNTINPVMHLPISFNADENITDEQAKKAIDSILADIGVDRAKHQFIIVEHRDKPNTRHFHCVVNRVDTDAKLLSNSKLVYKLQVACDKVEKVQGLQQTPNRTIIYDPTNENGYSYLPKDKKDELAIKKIQSGKLTPITDDKRPNRKLAIEEIQAKVAEVQKSNTKSPEEFKQKLAEKGIEVKYSYDQKNDNAIRGASFKTDKIKVRGGQIGMNWQVIDANLEYNKAKYLEVTVPSKTAQTSLKAEQEAMPTLIPIGTVPIAQEQTEEKVKEPTKSDAASQHITEKELGESIAQSGKEVLKTVKSPEEFKQKLAEKGIIVDFTLQAKGISGVKFTQNGISFKGSDVGLKVKEIEEKIKSNLDQEIAPGATPIPTPTVEPFRKKDEPLVRKQSNHTPFIRTLTAKELSEKAHIEKVNADLKTAIENFPRLHVDLVKHLQETNNIEERGDELVIYTENTEVSILNKVVLKNVQSHINPNYFDYEKKMKAYEELKSTPIKKGSWFESAKDKEERESKNKKIANATMPKFIPLDREDKAQLMKAIEIPNPFVERERAYELERGEYNHEVWKHNYKIAEIEEKLEMEEDKEEKKDLGFRYKR